MDPSDIVSVTVRVRNQQNNKWQPICQLHYKTYANEGDWSCTKHLQIRCHYGVKEIKHKELFVLRIYLIHVYYLMYFYYLSLFVIQVLSLDKLADLLVYLSLSIIHCISTELLYVCLTVGVWIGKRLSNWTTTGNTNSLSDFIKIDSSDEMW